jgi:hypothetical protein
MAKKRKRNTRAARVRKSDARCTATSAEKPKREGRQRRQSEKPQAGDRHRSLKGTQERQASPEEEEIAPNHPYAAVLHPPQDPLRSLF